MSVSKPADITRVHVPPENDFTAKKKGLAAYRREALVGCTGPGPDKSFKLRKAPYAAAARRSTRGTAASKVRV